MKIVVITGSTSGIGLGLADAFLARDCAAAISGHSQIHLDKAYGMLAGKYDKNRILAYLCEVGHYDEVQGLWNAAVEKFGRVDIDFPGEGEGFVVLFLGAVNGDIVFQAGDSGQPVEQFRCSGVSQLK